MQLVNLFVYYSNITSSQTVNTPTINNIFSLLQLYFPDLPPYHQCPRTELGRPYLASPVHSLNNSTSPSLLNIFLWNDFCKNFNLESHKHYQILDFNVSNSGEIVCCSILLTSSNQDYLHSAIPTVGIDIEFFNRKLRNRKVFSHKILNSQDLWATKIISIEKSIFNNNYQKINNYPFDYRCATLITWGAKEAIIKAYGGSIFQGKNIALSSLGIAVDPALKRYEPHRGDNLTTRNFLVHSPIQYTLNHYILLFSHPNSNSNHNHSEVIRNGELVSYCIYAPSECNKQYIHFLSSVKLDEFLDNSHTWFNRSLSEFIICLTSPSSVDLTKLELNTLSKHSENFSSTNLVQIISRHHL